MFLLLMYLTIHDKICFTICRIGLLLSESRFNNRGYNAYVHKPAVLMLREQVAPTVTAWCTSFSSQNFPTSVLLQEQCDEYRPLLHISKKDKTCQV